MDLSLVILDWCSEARQGTYSRPVGAPQSLRPEVSAPCTVQKGGGTLTAKGKTCKEAYHASEEYIQILRRGNGVTELRSGLDVPGERSLHWT